MVEQFRFEITNEFQSLNVNLNLTLLTELKPNPNLSMKITMTKKLKALEVPSILIKVSKQMTTKIKVWTVPQTPAANSIKNRWSFFLHHYYAKEVNELKNVQNDSFQSSPEEEFDIILSIYCENDDGNDFFEDDIKDNFFS